MKEALGEIVDSHDEVKKEYERQIEKYGYIYAKDDIKPGISQLKRDINKFLETYRANPDHESEKTTSPFTR